VTLSALAAGLLNFGDQVGRISAAMFSFVGECAAGARLRGKEADEDKRRRRQDTVCTGGGWLAALLGPECMLGGAGL
jgi:hypothetical protein